MRLARRRLTKKVMLGLRPDQRPRIPLSSLTTAASVWRSVASDRADICIRVTTVEMGVRRDAALVLVDGGQGIGDASVTRRRFLGRRSPQNALGLEPGGGEVDREDGGGRDGSASRAGHGMAQGFERGV
ncbi:hypothetical protein CP532_1609 [Ophiocordyceps camponoti-leonardi (nom. inval.)]|nr:hypothetical protein CP532_1609 [Ophiocordyceps camponoti-leonardi (nom. inval.)]